jgi:tetratricopeptide (TPR) repeat protein
VVVQVINARGSETGKPDVVVGFRLFRRHAGVEEPIGTLAPQLYNELTLPLDFDVTKQHPIFAAVAVPLGSFKRGDYRLEVSANDRLASRSTRADATFSVAATPAALLREAPPFARRFDPASLAGPLKQTLQQQPASPAAVQIMLGAQRAGEGNDPEAIAIWEAAVNGGADRAVVAPLLLDALLRRGESARAIEVARQTLAAGSTDPRTARQLAAAYLADGRHQEALQVLENRLAEAPDDVDAQWLAIHVLFAGFVSGTGPGSNQTDRARLSDLLTSYLQARGPHRALAEEWLTAIR